MSYRLCPTCNKSLPTTRFEQVKGGRKTCKSCRNERRKKSEGRTGTGLRIRYLWAKYKLTETQYLQMLEQQNGVCKICKGQDNGPHNRLAVDHCHKTGKVRGLLCAKCNKGLGQFNDSPQLLEGAITYLKIFHP